MVILIDASALLTVLFNEPEAEHIKELCIGAELIAPECIDFEIGNALSSQIKRSRLLLNDAVELFSRSRVIPIKKYPVDIIRSLQIAGQNGIYAYDAYYLTICERLHVPLLTLDNQLAAIAASLEIPVFPLR